MYTEGSRQRQPRAQGSWSDHQKIAMQASTAIRTTDTHFPYTLLPHEVRSPTSGGCVAVCNTHHGWIVLHSWGINMSQALQSGRLKWCDDEVLQSISIMDRGPNECRRGYILAVENSTGFLAHGSSYTTTAKRHHAHAWDPQSQTLSKSWSQRPKFRTQTHSNHPIRKSGLSKVWSHEQACKGWRAFLGDRASVVKAN